MSEFANAAFCGVCVMNRNDIRRTAFTDPPSAKIWAYCIPPLPESLNRQISLARTGSGGGTHLHKKRGYGRPRRKQVRASILAVGKPRRKQARKKRGYGFTRVPPAFMAGKRRGRRPFHTITITTMPQENTNGASEQGTRCRRLNNIPSLRDDSTNG